MDASALEERSEDGQAQSLLWGKFSTYRIVVGPERQRLALETKLILHSDDAVVELEYPEGKPTILSGAAGQLTKEFWHAADRGLGCPMILLIPTPYQLDRLLKERAPRIDRAVFFKDEIASAHQLRMGPIIGVLGGLAVGAVKALPFSADR
jgi:hypothetical protein